MPTASLPDTCGTLSGDFCFPVPYNSIRTTRREALVQETQAGDISCRFRRRYGTLSLHPPGTAIFLAASAAGAEHWERQGTFILSAAEFLGTVVEKTNPGHPAASRRILRTGWEVQDYLFQHHPHPESFPADQYLAKFMMDAMLQPLKDPDHSCIVSIFTPCEMVQEAGLHPYNVEGFSCYLSASFAGGICTRKAERDGISDTLCSYHKTFVGAAMNGLLPKPRCILYTSLACDANLLTFPKLAAYYQVPSFCIDVPADASEDAVAYVRDELVGARRFLEETTGRSIEEDALKARVKRSRESLLAYEQVQRDRADRFVPADLVTPLYSAMTANILLGTPEEERYVHMLQEDLRSALPKRGKHIYWMHTIPFWSDAVKKYFLFQDSAQIVACELAKVCSPDFDTDDPMLGMAQRLVRNAINGPAERRIANGIRHARDARADGVIWFNHWGCRHTLGISRLAKQAFEDAGFPTLLLDGDGCDRAHGGEGQTSTRIGAFLEMLRND